MGKNNILGSWGEMVAAEFLRQKHYKTVAMGYHSKFGEIDLIVCNRRYLVFVEVKLRRTAAFAEAKEHVDFYKQNRIRTTAELYLSQCPTKLQPRFDVIEIYAPDGTESKNLQIFHLEGAFT